VAKYQTQGIVSGRTKARGIVGLTTKRVALAIDLNRRQIQDLGGSKAQRPMFPKMHIASHPPVQKPNLILQAQSRSALTQLHGGMETDAMRTHRTGETVLSCELEEGTVTLRHGLIDSYECKFPGAA
jgi:hypothetical protein